MYKHKKSLTPTRRKNLATATAQMEQSIRELKSSNSALAARLETAEKLAEGRLSTIDDLKRKLAEGKAA